MNSPFLLLVLAASSAVFTARGARPADYPDAAHVPQGCYLSSVGFIARYTADHPSESGEALTVATGSYPGSHTVALVTYEGTWWVRDEYFGVFSLGARVGQHLSPADLSRRAEWELRQRYFQKSGGRNAIAASVERCVDDAAGRLANIELAQRLLPCASQVVWVNGRAGRHAFLFFSPAPRTVAVYEPSTGTVSAQCASQDALAVVRWVATRQGYGVRSVEPAKPAPATAGGLIVAMK